MRKRKPAVNYRIYPHPIYSCPVCDCNLAFSGYWRAKYCPECGLGIDWTGFSPERDPVEEAKPWRAGWWDWRTEDKKRHEREEDAKRCQSSKTSLRR